MTQYNGLSKIEVEIQKNLRYEFDTVNPIYEVAYYVKKTNSADEFTIRYKGTDRSGWDYYKYLCEKLKVGDRLQVTIKGMINGESIEYQGTGLIKILSDPKK